MRTLLAVILIAALVPAFSYGTAHAQGSGGSTPSLSLSSGTLTPGQTVTVSGSGFTPGREITVTVTFTTTGYPNSGTKTVSSTKIDGSDGTFSTPVTVPRSTTPGGYTIQATGSNGSERASARLTIIAGISVDHPVFTAGAVSSITVTGAGFGANKTVTVSLTVRTATSTVTTHKNPTTQSDGTFSTQLSIPTNIAPDRYTVSATESNPDRHASAYIHAVLVTASPSTVAAGQNVTIRGYGFVPNATRTVYATFTLAGGSSRKTLSANVHTDGSGNFVALLSVPKDVAGGTYTVHVSTGTSSPDLTHTSLTVRPAVIPAISLSNTTVSPGATITVTGRNFGPNQFVTLSATLPKLGGGNLTVRTTARTGSDGTFSTHFTIPTDAAPGTITVHATSTEGSATLSATSRLTVLARQPAVRLSSSSVRPGRTITVSGSGFSPNTQLTIRATVPLYSGGAHQITINTRTGPAGRFSAQLAVPGRASAGGLTVTVTGPRHQLSAHLQVQALRPTIDVSPASVVPGSTVTIRGSGYLPNTTVDIHAAVTLTNGSMSTLHATAKTSSSGSFQTQLHIPQAARSGGYLVTAVGSASGRSPSARLTVVKLNPTVVVAPTATAPGSKITVNGFGFASQATVTITINGQQVGAAHTGANGEFSTQVTVPTGLATGSYTVGATSQSNRQASAKLSVNRAFNTHYYFGALYTGHSESLAILNPTSTTARVTITYQTSTGRTITRTFQVAGHHTYIRNVNADLGPHVSAAATVAADVAIGASRVNYQDRKSVVVPGNARQSTTWYFATGNTGGKYRVYLAIQNTSNAAVGVRIRLMPGHHKAFDVYRSIPATSRKTLKINNFVHHDSVGITVYANRPVVANRTIKVLNGVNSKHGATSPSRTWYFAGGPRNPAAHNWLNISSPNSKYTFVTISAYGPDGALLRTKNRWLKPNARVGIFIRTFAGQNDAAVKLTASRPIVAEDMTYVGRQHDAYTDTFGVRAPVTTRLFPAVSTQSAGSHQAAIQLF